MVDKGHLDYNQNGFKSRILDLFSYEYHFEKSFFNVSHGTPFPCLAVQCIHGIGEHRLRKRQRLTEERLKRPIFCI